MKPAAGSAASNLRIKRILQQFQAIANIDAAPGIITTLTDEAGVNLKALEANLSNKETTERFSFEWGSETLESSQYFKVGFDENLPPGVSIPDYLKEHGVPEDKVDALLDSFELKKYCYLHCAQLPFNQARQLFLLAACYCAKPVVFLNDPFLPFSGRWREVFAELLLKQVELQKKAVVIINLSFPPQCWGKSTRICSIDMGQIIEKAITKATQVAKEQAEAEKLEKQVAIAARDENPYYARKAVFVLPEKITFAFRETRDFIFEPLARAVGFMRSYGGALAISGCAFLVLVMGFVMFPGLADKRAKLREMASSFSYKLSDFGFQSSSAPSVSPEMKVDPVVVESVVIEPAKVETKANVETSEIAPELVPDQPGIEVREDTSLTEPNIETMFSKFTLQTFGLCLETTEKSLGTDHLSEFRFEYETTAFCEPEIIEEVPITEDLNPVLDKE